MHYPRHIGIIPDGNRTRAKQRELPSMIGHTSGYNNAKNLMRYFFSTTPIEIVTMRGSSIENIQERSPEELEHLYEIYQIITDEIKEMYTQYGIGFKRIGSQLGLPITLVDFFSDLEVKYPSKNGKYFVLAVNYGGNDEIVRGINRLLTTHPGLSHISANQLSSAMDLGNFPPIELVIRTKGSMASRLSGFMTWRISYAELYFSSELFPDFGIPQLEQALQWYSERVEHRNFGK